MKTIFLKISHHKTPGRYVTTKFYCILYMEGIISMITSRNYSNKQQTVTMTNNCCYASKSLSKRGALDVLDIEIKKTESPNALKL